MADELERAGIQIGERRAWRLCSQQKLWSTTVKKGRKGKRPGPPVNDDLLRREKRRLEMENEILRRAAAYFASSTLPK